MHCFAMCVTWYILQSLRKMVKICKMEKNCEKSLDIISWVLYNNGKKPSCFIWGVLDSCLTYL